MKISIVCLLSFCLAAHAATPWRDNTPRTAVAELFGWNWNSVARECTNFLGPKGYRTVKVMPANEHISDNHWWARYQPVSYRIQTYAGSRAEFQAMTTTCHAAGVEVEVDTIINHMANGAGTGSAGSGYNSDWLSYEGVPFGSNDFHPACMFIQTDINTYTRCWLGRKAGDAGLPDLDTGTPYVQGKLIGHLNDLRSLGADGFYIDAAKHILVSELRTMLNAVPGPYSVAQEVWTDAVSPAPAYQLEYTQLGLVTEFNYARVVRSSFKNLSGRTLSGFSTFLASADRVPSNASLVFVTNHDLERSACTQTTLGGDCATLTVLQPDYYFPANVFMLAHPYGTPYVYSSYYFADAGDGPGQPPYVANETEPANCSSTVIHGRWNCSHRDWRIANMVGFRNYTAGTDLLDWQNEGGNRVSFRRGDKGFVALNNTSTWWQKSFATGLADGVYCNVVASANPETGQCPLNTQVNVSGGLASLTIAPWSTAALHVGARQPCNNPNDFSFAAVEGANPGTVYESAIVTISGLSCAVAVNISGGEYRIDGGAWASNPATINNGQTLQLRLTAPPTAGSTSTAAINVGSDTIVFRVSTASTDRCAGVSSCTVPAMPQAGQPVTVLYKGILQNSASMKLHWGVNSWTAIQDTTMSRDNDGYWSATITLPTATRELNYVSNNGSRWDNNGGRDWKIAVAPCSSCSTISVTFTVNATTAWGESIYISGNTAELGNGSMNPAALPKCSPIAYPLWTCRINFIGGARSIDYRYVKLGLTPRAESTLRTMVLPASGSLTRDDGSFRP